MPYASVDDVEAIMGGDVDEARTETLLELAASMIDAYNASIAAMTPVPPAARIVNANMVVRVLTNPLGVKSEQLASFSTTYGEATAGMTLTADDMAMLDAIPSANPPQRVYDVVTPRPDDERQLCGFYVVGVPAPATDHPVDVDRSDPLVTR